MQHIVQSSAVWYNALTVDERITSLRTDRLPRPPAAVDQSLAQRRIARWRAQPPFTITPWFARRLSLDGITEEELGTLLGEPIECVADRLATPPEWLEELMRALDELTIAVHDPIADSVIGHGSPVTSLLNVVAPLIRRGRAALWEGLQSVHAAHADLPFEPATLLSLFLTHLVNQLLEMAQRTLVLELHVARLQGTLAGATPQERFASFIERLQTPEIALAIWQEYPVLMRHIVTQIEQWSARSLEFAQRLGADWEDIRRIFDLPADVGLLESIDDVGDPHRGGRSVLIARFSSGARLVYKPKPLAVDAHFQELLAWLNQWSAHPPFRTLRILDRGSYGWEEYVVARPCDSEAAIQRFYQRQGAFIALLYALEATDFHGENIIAAGEHPVLIDVEALFHPRLGLLTDQHADGRASAAMAYSVLRTGLLPQHLWSNDESTGVDVSGLGFLDGQLSASAVPYWENSGTDVMRLARKRMQLPGSQNRPTLRGAEINVLDYAEDIIIGFIGMYHVLLTHRDELWAPSGLLARFARDQVRVVVRPTHLYSRLLHASWHPDVLRNALDRDRLFDWLWAGVENYPDLVKVIAAERADLQRGDIPLFTTYPSARDIWSSTGQLISNFVRESGLAVVQRRMQQMSMSDCARQSWFIRASLTTLAVGEDRALAQSSPLVECGTTASADQFLDAARAIADRLSMLALQGDEDATWIGLSLTARGQWSLAPLGLDLYDGLPGIILFLAHLGAVTGEMRYTALAQAAVVTLQRQISQQQAAMTSIGGFEGWGGVIYTLAHLSTLWQQPALLSAAEAIAAMLTPLIERDSQLDIISGSAGCIGGLLSLYRCAPSQQTYQMARQCGVHLVESARTMGDTVAWMTGVRAQQPLTGFSHGAAGISWALLELADVTHEQQFAKVAHAAIHYERQCFSPEAGNWPDLRLVEQQSQAETAQNTRFVSVWCYGAPGIGLARLQALKRLNDPMLRIEIDIACQTTSAHGFGFNHSLCHGDLGNLELLLQASRTLGEPQWQHATQQLASMILESIQRDGWRCGTPLGVETPGLMTGLAGIGYGLLRLAAPDRVPSVLTLAPPVSQV